MVLSSGMKPSTAFTDLAGRVGLAPSTFGFLRPPSTIRRPPRPGVFVCGGIETPKDIPETIIQAGAAAAEASPLYQSRHGETAAERKPAERPVDGEPRVGVLVCHCGTNIAGVVNIHRVLDDVKKLPQVVFAADFMFTCSTETQPRILE